MERNDRRTKTGLEIQMTFRIKFEYQRTGVVDTVIMQFEDWFSADYWAEKEKINRNADFYHIQ